MPPPTGSPERTFARRVRRERIRHGWRQEDLADRLAARGIRLHPSAIAKIERDPDDRGSGARFVRLDEAAALAAAFGLSIDVMLSDDDLGEPTQRLDRIRAELEEAVRDHTAAADAARRAVRRVERLGQLLASAEADAPPPPIVTREGPAALSC